MCGICGVLNYKGQKIDENLIKAMSDKLEHRGPDSFGKYIDQKIGLGHRRLSIIDLKSGQQPISNEDKTIWLIVNGEIYNYRELRDLLEKQGHVFSTNSDSEVIVHLYEQYQEQALDYLRGMFAFALWDKKKNKLFIARDRMGQKPLVYWHDDKQFVFASELRSLLICPWIKREIDPEALNLYLSFLYVPAPKTMFKNIKKLLPAHYLVVENGKLEIKKYWSLQPRVDRRKSLKDYKQGIIEQLDQAVKLRLASDVPLGVFLSGGIDSSAIVSRMSKYSSNIKTFSVGFENKLYNELGYARIIAKKFSTEHHELIIKPKAIEIMPKLISHYGEPYADYSCIPTYYIAKFAANHIKVALCGDGGDESFNGYYRYTATKVAQAFDCLPRFLCKLISRTAIGLLPDGNDIRSKSWQIKRFFSGLEYPPVQRYLNWIACFNQQQKKYLLNSDFFSELNINTDLEYLQNAYLQIQSNDFSDATRQVDIDTYLPNDLLVKMDIASMANSLEARAPFLDHKFMEYASQIPHDLKLHNLQNKFILKKALADSLPKDIINRKKQGFAIPIGQWFRHELKDYAYDQLLDKACIDRGYFKQNYLKQILDEHIAGKTDNGYKLYTLLMFELWAKEFIDG
ncbi:MAG: asparagine synthase (glutamine-hydrolyzing) [Candidatus Omnitrophica bacterium]|nr:asparagine synthase (glutamine-hydrolyzing) [Candidatus Omnitrophota bacterium]